MFDHEVWHLVGPEVDVHCWRLGTAVLLAAAGLAAKGAVNAGTRVDDAYEERGAVGPARGVHDASGFTEEH